MTVLLGIHDGHHANASIFVDGRLIAAFAEERLSRKKLEYGYPHRSIELCLKMAGATHQDIDEVALSTRSLPPRYFMTKRSTTFGIKDYWREQKDYWYPIYYEGVRRSYLDIFADKVAAVDFPYDRSLIANEDDGEGMLAARIDYIARMLALPPDKITVYDHQSCHAYFSMLSLPDRDKPRLLFTADGAGDGANGSIWHLTPDRPLRELMRTNQCNIGRLYRYITLVLGMKPNEHEYKVMGLAPYSSAYTAQGAYDVFAETLQNDGVDFSYKVRPKDHFWHFKKALETERFDGIARALQTRTEELLTGWIGNAVRKYGVRDVAFSGGVALNVKANKLITELDGVDSLFVGPGANDESLSLGAAYQHLVLKVSAAGRSIGSLAPFPGAYLGDAHNDDEIGKLLDSERAREQWTVEPAAPPRLAEVLNEGGVIGRFSGRMEFGPRALGNRSIIADPRRRDTVRIINEMIKMRDFWMPFCPSMLAERAADYLVNPKDVDASYMTIGFESTARGREDLPAALHPYDQTARPQAVSREANPGYHAVIKAFEDLTGVGCVLNTSFNLHGEPIVATPADAISTFKRSGLSHIALGDYLVSKA
jgi:carbamoyltransferase